MITSTTFVRSQRQRLLESLRAQPESSPFECEYAFALYRRVEAEAEYFGVVTPGGESLRLTPRLLHGLALHRCRLRGDTQVALALPPVAETWQAAGLDAPLEELRLEFFRNHATRDETLNVAYVSRAREFRHATVVLIERHPAGWPL